MKKLMICLLGSVFLWGGMSQAQLRASKPGLVLTDLNMDNLGAGPIFGKKKKRRKKKRRKNTLAVGAVVGGPIGFGGRVVFRPTRLGVAGDIAYNRVRTDAGPLVGVMTAKVDARLYSKGILSRVIRPYIFGGMMLQRGQFDKETPIMQSVYGIDAGIGGGVKLWRLEFNGEIGLGLPVKGVETYKPRVNPFANLGILVWLI